MLKPLTVIIGILYLGEFYSGISGLLIIIYFFNCKIRQVKFVRIGRKNEWKNN